MRQPALKPLEDLVGHEFDRHELLERALTHSSHARESETRNRVPDTESHHDVRRLHDNEQLEFLGDAVLGFITSQELFHRFPDYTEGELSKLKAHLVSARHLIRTAREIELGNYLRLGRGEEKTGGRAKAALLVDALEALIAALYLDAGMEKAREFILARIVEPELHRILQDGNPVDVMDHKSQLQEIVQASGRPQPSYVLVREEGPEHRKTFTVEARILPRGGSEPEFIGRGEGPTKKKAEQGAANEALAYLTGQAAASDSSASTTSKQTHQKGHK